MLIQPLQTKTSDLTQRQVSIENDVLDFEKLKAEDGILDSHISFQEVEMCIKQLKPRKAPGSDKIRNEMLKTCMYVLKKALLKLFALILKSGFFPSSWCEGTITPIYKTGPKDDPSNYRGICINSCLGKLFTSILNNRLKNIL